METPPEQQPETSSPQSSQPSPVPAQTSSSSEAQDTSPSLEPFYARLLNVTFTDSAKAIQQCRTLCAELGFTVKQEASTHKNIYIYCSREGLPDSQRNPRRSPKRKRPSKRCDCRWRVVLFERGGQWKFRKSLNPEAAKHNHELMRPEEIETTWPKEVVDVICALAKQHLSTSAIRSQVQAQFSRIVWNERRFYNRLSEARQKIKQQETAARSHRLTSVWARVCMAAAGSEELSRYAEDTMLRLLEEVCHSSGTDPSTLIAPNLTEETTEEDTGVGQEQPQSSTTTASVHESSSSRTTAAALDQARQATEPAAQPQAESSRRPTAATATSARQQQAPKGFIRVDIPKHTYFVKLHNQRVGSELHEERSSRRQQQEEERRRLLASTRRLSMRARPADVAPGQVYIPERVGPPVEHVYQAQVPNLQAQNTPQPSFLYPSAYSPTGMPMQNYAHNFRPPYNLSPTTPGYGVPSREMQIAFDPSSPAPIIHQPNTTATGEPAMHSALQQQQQQQQQQQEHQELQPQPQEPQQPEQQQSPLPQSDGVQSSPSQQDTPMLDVYQSPATGE